VTATNSFCIPTNAFLRIPVLPSWPIGRKAQTVKDNQRKI